MRLSIVRGDPSHVVEMFPIEISDSAKVEELMKKIAEKSPKHSVSRQRLTVKKGTETIVLERIKPLNTYNVSDGCQIHFKDLGPQLPYRTVFILEYLGPLVIYPLFAWRLIPFVYPDSTLPSTIIQQVALALWTLHYVKREVETVFVHEFGWDTMPPFNLFKNCVYYWGFAAIVAWAVNYPGVLPANWSINLVLGAIVFIFGLLCNGKCHLMLKRLRKPGVSEMQIPRGFLFEYVTKPNYFFEILTWFGFNILTGFTIPGILFNIAGAYQMIVWARQGHAKLRKIFPDYPKNRKAIFPFIL